MVSTSTKNSRAATRRVPRLETSSTAPPRVASASGISELGSACATDPPSVPRLRVWKCPTCGSASASNGTDCIKAALRIAAACLSVAPVRISAPCATTPSMPGTRFTSISAAGRTRRMFSIGPSDMPPASTLASGPNSSSNATASATLSGRQYSNATGFIGRILP